MDPVTMVQSGRKLGESASAAFAKLYPLILSVYELRQKVRVFNGSVRLLLIISLFLVPLSSNLIVGAVFYLGRFAQPILYMLDFFDFVYRLYPAFLVIIYWLMTFLIFWLASITFYNISYRQEFNRKKQELLKEFNEYTPAEIFEAMTFVEGFALRLTKELEKIFPKNLWWQAATIKKTARDK